MNKEEINSLIKLREYLINEHASLDGHNSPNTAIIKQSHVAKIIETSIRSIDGILKSHVTFKQSEK